MRRSLRFAAGVLAGAAVLVGYLSTVGVGTVSARATAVASWTVGVVIALVATAAVLVVRTVALPFGALAGGLCAAYLRGWRLAGSGS